MEFQALNCPICLEILNSELIIAKLSSCSHLLCQMCSKQFIRYSNKCPVCLKEFLHITSFHNGVTVEEYSIKEEDLNAVHEHKNSFTRDETFECIPKIQIEKELKEYKHIADEIYRELFMRRNSDGSNKERTILADVFERIDTCTLMLLDLNYDNRIILENLNHILVNIQSLKERKYKHEHFYDDDSSYFEDNLSHYKIDFTIEYVESKNKKKQKSHKPSINR